MADNSTPVKLKLPLISNPRNQQNIRGIHNKRYSIQENYYFEKLNDETTRSNKIASEFSTFTSSMEIPKINYSSFKRTVKAKNERRKSNVDIIMNNLKNINNQKAKFNDIAQGTNAVKKKIFKRIEPHEIEYPSKSFGEKLIRVHKLVLDPLRNDESLIN